MAHKSCPDHSDIPYLFDFQSLIPNLFSRINHHQTFHFFFPLANTMVGDACIEVKAVSFFHDEFQVPVKKFHGPFKNEKDLLPFMLKKGYLLWLDRKG